jgi:hypothetical protein
VSSSLVEGVVVTGLPPASSWRSLRVETRLRVFTSSEVSTGSLEATLLTVVVAVAEVDFCMVTALLSQMLVSQTWLMFDLIVEVLRDSTFSVADLPGGSAIVVTDVAWLAMLMLVCRCGGGVVAIGRELYSFCSASGSWSLDNMRRARPSPGPGSSL